MLWLWIHRGARLLHWTPSVFPTSPWPCHGLAGSFPTETSKDPKRYHAFPLSAQGCRIDNLALAFLTSSVDWSVTSWPAVKQKETTPGIPVMVFPNSIEMFFFLKMYSWQNWSLYITWISFLKGKINNSSCWNILSFFVQIPQFVNKYRMAQRETAN